MCAEPTGGILDFCSIYRFYDALLGGGLHWLAFGLAGFTLAFLVINSMVATTALYTWFERRTLGRFQSRLGPNRWGPFGLLQPLADVLKLLSKEDTVPEGADRPVFTMAPVALLVPTLVMFGLIPFGPDSFLGRLNVGVLLVVAITSVNSLAIFMAGWASRNKYAMFGAMRSVAMLISYEVPMGLAIAGVLLLAGSLSLFQVVEAQAVPFLLVQPLALLVFMTAALAEMNRTPFDMIEAESELGGGYHTEYSGIKFALFQLAEFMAPVATAVLFTVLFFGGTRGFDPIPGQVWFGLKTFVVVFALLWARATWPRLRIDQIMAFAWKGLFPMALVNLFAVAVQMQILGDPETGALSRGDLWIMAAVNWVLAVVVVVLIANLLGQRRVRPLPPRPVPLTQVGVEAD